jgi:monoamine oxidase
VAAPLNTWTSIDFDPPLSEAKRELAARGHAGHGLKVIVRVRGRHDLRVVLPESSLFTWIQVEYLSETETIFVAHGPDGAVLSPTNNAAIREAFESAIPGLDILEVIGHDWEGDAFSRGTWSMYRPGQLTRSVPAARMPEGRLVFAGADLARGWTGFVDGAIESGLTAAIAVRQALHI